FSIQVRRAGRIEGLRSPGANTTTISRWPIPRWAFNVPRLRVFVWVPCGGARYVAGYESDHLLAIHRREARVFVEPFATNAAQGLANWNCWLIQPTTAACLVD